MFLRLNLPYPVPPKTLELVTLIEEVNDSLSICEAYIVSYT